MDNTLTPIVRWAQNGPQIEITIDLCDVKNPNIELNETSLHFKGFGHGAQGEDIYNVELDFFNKIDYKGSTYNITGRNISFKILKQIKGEEWPRLLQIKQKPVWLKIDFDKWRVEDSDDDRKKGVGGDDDQEAQINKISFEQKIKTDVQKAKDDLVIYSKVAWLSTYYLFQSICFIIILGELICSIYKGGEDVAKNSFKRVIGVLLTCQLIAVAEIIHPLIGITNTGIRAPLIQVCTRNFILFTLIIPVKQFHDSRIVTILFFAWAVHEIIRFPHNILLLHGFKYWLPAWIRYSYWILVYPIGFISAGIIIFQSIFIANEMHRWEYSLPNQLNISFSLSSFLVVFFCLYWPGCLYLLKHMWILRERKLGGRAKKMKAKGE